MRVENNQGGVSISIHAPTRGATFKDDPNYIKIGISIHAPTRGATWITISTARMHFNFNPRSHEGSDKKERVITDEVLNFNPRSHEGSDLSSFKYAYLKDISIHAPTRGATLKNLHLFIDITIFQSTLPRGERLWDYIPRFFLSYFNPRSHEGSDPYYFIS